MIELHGWVTIRETYEARFDEEEKENQFQVFSISRGIVQELNDVYLSPIISIIEDGEASLSR